jgi:hypothetical protein
MGFQDVDDFDDLNELPPLEDGFDLPDFGEEEGGGGVSRTFKIVGAILVLAVIGLIVLVLVLALNGGDEISPNARTATKVAELNATTQKEYENTLTANAMALMASETAVQSANLTATVTQQAFETQQAQMATDTANTATAQAAASQTAAAEQAEREATSQAQTATAAAERTVFGHLVGRDNTPFGGVTIQLFRDDGDGVFNPSEDIPLAPPESGDDEFGAAATPEAGDGGAAVTGATAIQYGETVDGEVGVDDPDLWVFTGSAGDVVSINSAANADAAQLDLFLVLMGPDGTNLTEDDDSGDQTNAAILGFALPDDGEYTIRVSTVAGPGGYSLTLSTMTAAPADDETQEAGVSYAPKAELRIRQGTPTPTLEPGLDEFITSIITGPEGEFNFGALEPGIYWLVLDYATLPPDIQAQFPAGEPVFIMVNVPVTGEVTFTVGVEPTPTPTPFDPIIFTQTANAVASMTAMALSGTPGFATLTNTPEPQITVSRIPDTGLFSDIGTDDGGLEGSSGLTILAIAAVGLVAVVFIARKLRTSA